MTDEKLIEKAAKAIWEESTDFGRMDSWDTERDFVKDEFESMARAALAVFEEQQKPSEDEREALARTLFIASYDFAYAERMAKAWDAPGPHGRARWYNYADAILAAGFRRPVSPEPSAPMSLADDPMRAPFRNVRAITEQTEPTDALPLDPQPWLFISDQVFGEFRSDHDKGYHDVSGTYWVFSPRDGYEQDRGRYRASNHEIRRQS